MVLHTQQSPAPLGRFLGPCRISCCVLCCQGSRLEPKRAGNYTHAVPQSNPRVTQIPMGGPSKTHSIYSVGATLSHFGRSRTIPFVSVCFPGAYFLRFPVTFAAWGVKLVLKMECSFLLYELQVVSFLDKAPTSGHSGVLDRSRVPYLVPNGVSEYQKTVQNREFWEEHLKEPEDGFFFARQCNGYPFSAHTCLYAYWHISAYHMSRPPILTLTPTSTTIPSPTSTSTSTPGRFS